MSWQVLTAVVHIHRLSIEITSCFRVSSARFWDMTPYACVFDKGYNIMLPNMRQIHIYGCTIASFPELFLSAHSSLSYRPILLSSMTITCCVKSAPVLACILRHGTHYGIAFL